MAQYRRHVTNVNAVHMQFMQSICELSSLAIQALGRKRVNSVVALNEILDDWQSDRNARQKGVNWHFTNEKARIKLKRLYPTPLFE